MTFKILCIYGSGPSINKAVNLNVDINLDVDVTYVNFAFY